jgi:hypothetical protein
LAYRILLRQENETGWSQAGANKKRERIRAPSLLDKVKGLFTGRSFPGQIFFQFFQFFIG